MRNNKSPLNIQYQCFPIQSILHCFTAARAITPDELDDPLENASDASDSPPSPEGMVGKSPQRPCDLSNHLLSWPKYLPCINVTSNSWCNQRRPKSLRRAWRGPSSASGGYRMVQSGAENPVASIPPVWPAACTARLGANRDFEVWTYDSDNSTCIQLGLAFYARWLKMIKF